MNIRSGTISDKSLRFTFGNVHEMPGWSTWLSEFFTIIVSLFAKIGWSHVCGIFRFWYKKSWFKLRPSLTLSKIWDAYTNWDLNQEIPSCMHDEISIWLNTSYHQVGYICYNIQWYRSEFVIKGISDTFDTWTRSTCMCNFGVENN